VLPKEKTLGDSHAVAGGAYKSKKGEKLSWLFVENKGKKESGKAVTQGQVGRSPGVRGQHAGKTGSETLGLKGKKQCFELPKWTGWGRPPRIPSPRQRGKKDHAKGAVIQEWGGGRNLVNQGRKKGKQTREARGNRPSENESTPRSGGLPGKVKTAGKSTCCGKGRKWRPGFPKTK